MRSRIVDDVSFTIGRGEVLALVGESGSGKSVTALSLMQLLGAGLSITGGRIMLHARDGFRGDIAALGSSGKAIESIRGRAMGMIFQEPMSSLLAGPHHRRADRGSGAGARAIPATRHARDRAAELLAKVGHARSDRRARPLSVGILRRHAPARHDRPAR